MVYKEVEPTSREKVLFVPKTLAENFAADNKLREEFFAQENPNGLVKIVWLPSGSGVNVKRTKELVSGIRDDLDNGFLEFTISLWTNEGQQFFF